MGIINIGRYLFSLLIMPYGYIFRVFAFNNTAETNRKIASFVTMNSNHFGHCNIDADVSS